MRIVESRKIDKIKNTDICMHRIRVIRNDDNQSALLMVNINDSND